MVLPNLENLAGPGKQLRHEPPDQAEFSGLQSSGTKRLKDAIKVSLSLESRFDLAYNAAHSLSLAALRWHGYRPANRYIVFQVLPKRSSLVPMSGAYSPNVMTYEISVSMKATWI